MTAYTAAATGDWNTAATWTPAGVPGNGDTVTVASPFNVTVATSESVIAGTSPTYAAAGTFVITVASGATLTVNGTLTVRGDISLSGVLQGAGTVQFDDSLSASPGGNSYRLSILNGYKAINAKLAMTGSKGARAIVQATPTSAPFFIDNNALVAANRDTVVQCTYCRFINIGSATHQGMTVWITNGNGYNATLGPQYNWFLRNCSFENYWNGLYFYTTATDQSSFEMSNVTFKNGRGGYSMASNYSAGYTGGTRLIQNCVFDKYAQFPGCYSLTVSGNAFLDTYTLVSTPGTGSVFTGNLVANQTFGNSSGDGSPSGQMGAMISYGMSWINNYFLYHRPGYGNPHFAQMFATPSANGTGAFVSTGTTFEFTGTDANGDCHMLYPAASGTANTITIQGCLVIPCSGGGTVGQSGVLFTDFGGTIASPNNVNYVMTVLHNTGMSQNVNGEGSCNIDENNGGVANQYAALKSNLFYGLSAPTGTQYGVYIENTPATDELPASVIGYNAFWNQSVGSCTSAGSSIATPGYHHLVFSSGVPGANDIFGINPGFVDATRNAATWAASLGLASTPSAALAAIATMNDDTGSVAGATPSALWTWVRAGFQPTAAGLRGKAHDGGDIGALAVKLPAAPALSGISASPGNVTVGAGGVISLVVATSSAVTVTGAPTLTLSDGDVATFASATSQALTFTYNVPAARTAASLQVTALNLNGGSIADAYGQALTFTGPVTPSPTDAVDSVQPALASLASSAAGPSPAGAALTFTVAWTKAVTLSNGATASLGLSNGGTATYAGGSGTTSWTFSYAVPVGSAAATLSATGVIVSGGTANDYAGNAANLSSVTGALGASIDGVAPVVVSVGCTQSGVKPAGSVLTFTVGWSKPVSLSTGGNATQSLSNGGTATLTGGSGTATWTFAYTVPSGAAAAALSASGMTITGTAHDVAGNMANLSGDTGSLGVSVDGVIPAVSATAPVGSGSVLDGAPFAVSLAVTKAVAVTAGATVLTSAGTATYDATTSTSTLIVFRGTVGASVASGPVSISAVTGTITDAAGNPLATSGAIGQVPGLAISSGAQASGERLSQLTAATSMSLTDSFYALIGGRTAPVTLATVKHALGLS